MRGKCEVSAAGLQDEDLLLIRLLLDLASLDLLIFPPINY